MSYRWRRRLVWLAALAVLVGGIVGVGVEWPNTAPKEAGPSGQAHINYAPPKKVRLNVRDKSLALAVASTFVNTAVARKNVDRSWNLVTPEFRSGVSRKEWDSGTLPSVPPFPVQEARWKFSYSDVEGVGYSIALFPKKGSSQRAQVFLVELRPVVVGKKHTYLISSWQAAPTSGVQNGPILGGGGGGGGGSPVEQASPHVSPSFNKAKESPIWLLLPFGLLSLVVIIPLAIGGVNWYRHYRARVKMGL